MYLLDRIEDISSRYDRLTRRINSRIRFALEKISIVQLIVFESVIVFLIAKTLLLQLGTAVGKNLGGGK